jgi:hypothetical protein
MRVIILDVFYIRARYIEDHCRGIPIGGHTEIDSIFLSGAVYRVHGHVIPAIHACGRAGEEV